jgi:hypothetical protein
MVMIFFRVQLCTYVGCQCESEIFFFFLINVVGVLRGAKVAYS